MEYERELYDLFSAPDKWAQAFLRNPNNKNEPLTLRSYQKEILEQSPKYRNIILRFGRRSGKSVVLCADTLWWSSAYPLVRMIDNGDEQQRPFNIIIATPYKTQVSELWTIYKALIADSPFLSQQVTRIRASNIHLIQFDNGSTIRGFTIGISSQNRGTSLRSLSADMIFLDEMDYIPEDIIQQVIMPIWTTHRESRFRISSTPSGARSLFWKWCESAEELGWLHKHVQSWHPDNTNWMSIEQCLALGLDIKESSEFQVRAITPDSAYQREYGAEFGEELGGVYRTTHIQKSLVSYGPVDVKDSDIFDPGFKQDPENLFIIGVDWNSYINGGQICLVEFCKKPTTYSFLDTRNQEVNVDFTGKFRLFYRRGIKSKESTQRQTREEILRLLRAYKIDYIYVDYGAGDTNIEELTYFDKINPGLNIKDKLRVVDSGASVEHYDPILKEKISKRNKSLMINFSVLNLENGKMLLPKEEDQKTRLVGQMRDYKVKTVTNRGDYTYAGEDHILDAFNLAIYGFQIEYSELVATRADRTLAYSPDPRAQNYPVRMSDVSNSIFTGFGNSFRMPIRDPEKPIRRDLLPKRSLMPTSGGRLNPRVTLFG
jgi:hypothetical protein